MEAKELRIGNLVIDEYGDLRKIISIEKKVVEFEHGIRQYYKDITPVQITETNLRMFRFKNEIPDSYQYGGVMSSEIWHNKIHLWLTPFDCAIFRYQDDVRKTIKYVHQLQNLYFALTGEELEIKQ